MTTWTLERQSHAALPRMDLGGKDKGPGLFASLGPLLRMVVLLSYSQKDTMLL